jgi:hypothetical protein
MFAAAGENETVDYHASQQPRQRVRLAGCLATNLFIAENKVRAALSE